MPDATPKSPVALLAPAILAAGGAAVVFALARFWGANPDHIDRLCILLAAGYAAWYLLTQLPRPDPRPVRFGYLPLLLGAVAFPVGWFLQAQVGPKSVVLWWLAGSWVVAVAGFLLVAGGWGYLRRLAFPLGFVLFALPVPNRVLVPLQFTLQSMTTTVAAWALPVCGVPVERSGFVLSLPGGDLGVAEACSGVRSVTALVAIAAFVAWWNGFGFLRGLVLVVLSVPVIAGVNAVRVIVSGLLQEHAGPEYVRGTWHEALGVAMVLVGLGIIVALAWVMGRKNPSPHSPPSLLGKGAEGLGDLKDPSPQPPPRSGEGEKEKTPPSLGGSQGGEKHPSLTGKGAGGLGLVLLACSAVAALTAQFLGAGAEQELVAAAPLEQLPRKIGRWEATDQEVRSEITDMLTPDAISHRIYRDAGLGYEVHAWVIFWSSRNMVKGYHHPDVCWPNRGFRLLKRDVVPLAAGGGTVPVTVREFTRDSHRQLVLYWTQEGRRVWSAEDEERVRATGDSHDWLGERLFRREPAAPTGRLVVLLGTPVWGDGTAIRSQTLELTAGLANELYRICPWAAPPTAEP